MGEASEGVGLVRYTRVAIALHWMIAILIVTNLTIGLLMDSLPRGTLPLHKSIGMLVLFLGLVRLGWRIGHRPPPLPTGVTRWERRIAGAVHWTFYALIILIPLSGWIFTSASLKRHPLSFFGIFPLPMFPVAQDKAIAGVWADRHELMAYLMIALLLLHVGGALKHRFIQRDRILDRMLPGTTPA